MKFILLFSIFTLLICLHPKKVIKDKKTPLNNRKKYLKTILTNNNIIKIEEKNNRDKEIINDDTFDGVVFLRTIFPYNMKEKSNKQYYKDNSYNQRLKEKYNILI